MTRPRKKTGNANARKRPSRQSRRSRTAPIQPVGPGVRRGFNLPYRLSDWHLLGKKWFENGIYDFFADLPAHFWEHPSTFAEGAIRVVTRLLQRSATQPFCVQKLHVKPRSTSFRYKNRLHTDDFSVVVATVEFSLNAPDAHIVQRVKNFLAQERQKRGITVISAHPAKYENLKRDLVIYVLDQEGWDIPSIQAQLTHMGCIPFPMPVDPVRGRLKPATLSG